MLSSGPASGELSIIGARINNYEVTQLLGEGGMGMVYLAMHPVLKRRAAVKVLRPEFSRDEQLTIRFVNEARAASAIRHRNIIEIIDVGTMPDLGVPYILMEFLEGESLAARLRRAERLSVKDVVEFAAQAADGLAAAHAKGIIHRDLKPDNLFLVPDSHEGTEPRELLKVLDFGIAKLRGDWGHNESAKTSTGSIMGTPPYMAPEQCRGLSDEIDARSDVYALGTILFEMLCGRPPFVSKGWGDVLMMHLTASPERPSVLTPGVPGYLDDVILKALAKNKEDRFQSMVDLRRALRAGPANPDVASAGLASRPDFVPVNPTVLLAPAQRSEPLPVTPAIRTTTTLSSVAGVREAMGSDIDDDFPPPNRQSRRVLMGVVGVAVAAAVAFVVLRGGSSRRPAGGVSAQGAPPSAPEAIVPAPLPKPASPRVDEHAAGLALEPAIPPRVPPLPGPPAAPEIPTPRKPHKSGTRSVRRQATPPAVSPAPKPDKKEPFAL